MCSGKRQGCFSLPLTPYSVMTSRPKSTPSLQSLLDTYHYLVRGLKGEAAPAPSRHAQTVARQLVVPAEVRKSIVGTLRTIPAGLAVAGLSSASVRVNDSLFLLMEGVHPFAHAEEKHLTPLALTETNDGNHTAAGRHQWLYTHRAAQAIVMVHPVGAVRCAACGTVPDPALFPAAFAYLGALQWLSADPAGWDAETMTGAPLLVADGTLIAYDDTLAGAMAKAEIAARWCEVVGNEGC